MPQKPFWKSFPFLLILPIEIVLWLILMVPFVIAIFLSFTSWSPGVNWWDARLIGLGNYADLLTNDRFLLSIGRSALFVAGGVTLQLVLGLALALLFYEPFKGRRIFTSILLLPMMVIPLVVGFQFYTLFFTEGPVNAILSMLVGEGFRVRWLSTPVAAFVTIVFADTWQWTPFMFLVLYSGLIALPQDPFRAASVLGASAFQVFRWVTLPLLKPIIFIAVLIRGLEAFKLFDVVWIITGGGPGTSTETVSVYLYREGFQFLRLSYIAAGAMIILAAIALIVTYASRPLMPLKEE